MKHIKNVMFAFLLLTISTYAQVGIGTSLEEASALLEVTSTTKGFLPPRLSEIQRDAIIDPAAGLIIYNITSKTPNYFDGTQWVSLHNKKPNESATICYQTWMVENLDVATYRDGTPIPEVQDPTKWMTLTTGAWCYYNNDPANGDIYGKLYNWYAVAGIHDNDPGTPNKELAPLGWHIPSNTEWDATISCLGGDSAAGGAMKETGTTHWINPNMNATNISDFTGLPGGFLIDSNPNFQQIGQQGYWWSSTEHSNISSREYFLQYGHGTILNSVLAKQYGLSVRCVKD